MMRRAVRTWPMAGAVAVTLWVTAFTLSAQGLGSVARPPAAPAQAAAQAPARGLLWKVDRDGRQAWLVGSLHLLPPDFYPLPDSLERAFAASDALMEEVDLDSADDPAVARTILSKAMNPPGVTLSSQLSKESLAAVTGLLSKAGLPISMLEQMKPWMVSMTLQALALQRIGFDPALGIDKHFADAAKRTRKPLLPLETVVEQIDFLDGLNPTTQDRMLRETIEALDTEMTQVREIAAAWRAGDAAAMERVTLADMKDAPDVYELLLAGRNRRWVPQIEGCMQTYRSCFVVVGAAHLIGSDGVPTLLKARGYTITQQ